MAQRLSQADPRSGFVWIELTDTHLCREFADHAAMLKVAEDISALLVLELDGDDRPDLLILRVMIPSVASIASGLLSELEVEISATGYGSEDAERTFSEKPRWKGTLTVVLPDVVGILRDPGAVLGKFQETASQFRLTAFGDFDGDGARDVAMVRDDETRVDRFRLPGTTMSEAEISGLASVFFSGDDRRWEIGKVLEWLGDLARERARRMTGDREPDRSVELRDAARYEIKGFASADVDGDGRDEVVVIYRDRRSHHAVVDAFGL